MNDIIYKLAAHAEALTDLARIRAAQAMLEARDEIVRLRARVEELERPLVMHHPTKGCYGMPPPLPVQGEPGA